MSAAPCPITSRRNRSQRRSASSRRSPSRAFSPSFERQRSTTASVRCFRHQFPGYRLGQRLTSFATRSPNSKHPANPSMPIWRSARTSEYYLATAADKIFLPPSGDIYINGFAAEAMFYKGSLDKLGIEADVIQIGPKYKNAPDRTPRSKWARASVRSSTPSSTSTSAASRTPSPNRGKSPLTTLRASSTTLRTTP